MSDIIDFETYESFNEWYGKKLEAGEVATVYLEEDDWETLQKALNNEPSINDNLSHLLNSKPPWENDSKQG